MVGGLERPRVAELIVDRGLPGARRGSRYLVSSAVVLTATHVVRNARTLKVRFNADREDEWTSDATVTFADPASDIGAVTLANPAAGPTPQVEFGALEDRPAVVPYASVGFPRFKLRTEESADDGLSVVRYRDAAHLNGTMASLANWRQGSLELVTDPSGGAATSGRAISGSAALGWPSRWRRRSVGQSFSGGASGLTAGEALNKVGRP